MGIQRLVSSVGSFKSKIEMPGDDRGGRDSSLLRKHALQRIEHRQGRNGTLSIIQGSQNRFPLRMNLRADGAHGFALHTWVEAKKGLIELRTKLRL